MFENNHCKEITYKDHYFKTQTQTTTTNMENFVPPYIMQRNTSINQRKRNKEHQEKVRNKFPFFFFLTFKKFGKKIDLQNFRHNILLLLWHNRNTRMAKRPWWVVLVKISLYFFLLLNLSLNLKIIKYKSLCNACGIYFLKNKKRESLIQPNKARRISITELLN